MRRAGKSTLLYGVVRGLVKSGVAWERIIYINFEDKRLQTSRKPTSKTSCSAKPAHGARHQLQSKSHYVAMIDTSVMNH
ncbi:AAA family ATPase [Collinsella tanakaei]|uniref:AAA family ATPase n=1 Tax=Collinsella tanakaei TaxID=626935 RepID=UPI0019582C71|nr:AAA family ATPase [Collinsella tanakaei]